MDPRNVLYNLYVQHCHFGSVGRWQKKAFVFCGLLGPKRDPDEFVHSVYALAVSQERPE